MIKKALVLLPTRSEPADTVSPVTRLGGLTLIQRTLYSLLWAGIEEGVVFSRDEWPEVAFHVRQDPRTKAFAWLSVRAGPEDSLKGSPRDRGRAEDWIVHFPGWIVDRHILKDFCRQEEALREIVLLEPPPSVPACRGAMPALALVPGNALDALLHALADKAPAASWMHGLEEIAIVRKESLPAEALIRVEQEEDLPSAEAQLFQRLIKPTESFLSQKFERRVSRAITRRLLDSKLTPNQISVASILLGVFSALLFLGEQRIAHVLGGILLVFSSIVDGCDGELARLRFQESRWGSWLDFVGDNVVHVSIFLCLGFGLYLRGEGDVYRVLACLAAAANLGAASAVFIRVFLKSRDGVITFATPVRVEEMDRTQGWLRRRIEFVDKLSNRDFFYLILFCAVIGQLWFFMWVGSVGVVFYFLNLVYLYHRMRAIR